MAYYSHPETIIAKINIQGNQEQLESDVPTNLTIGDDLNSRIVAHLRTLNFSSDDENRKYSINNKTFDPKRIDQRIKLGS